MIKIDIRENALIQKCRNLAHPNIIISTEALPIGDIILVDNDIEHIIIERKTIPDLLSSIKDGRYDEQSYRLNGIQHHNHNIIYLIEGNPNTSCRNSAEKTMLYSSMFSISYYKGFSIMRTNNVDETAFVLCNMLNKICKSKENRIPYYSNSNLSISAESTIP